MDIDSDWTQTNNYHLKIKTPLKLRNEWLIMLEEVMDVDGSSHKGQWLSSETTSSSSFASLEDWPQRILKVV